MVMSDAISARDGIPVPKERLFAYQELTTKRTVAIVVTRDSGVMNGGACAMEFWIDNTKVGIFERSEVATFYVEPTEHALEVNWDQKGAGFCNMQNVPNHLTTYAREGKRQVVYRLKTLYGKPMIGFGG